MEILCPRHHVPLTVKKQHFSLLNCDAYVGTCPHCQVQYIDRHFFQATPKFKVGGVQYEFLEGLHTHAARAELKLQEKSHLQDKPSVQRPPEKKKTSSQRPKGKSHPAGSHPKSQPVKPSVSPDVMQEYVIAMRRQDYQRDPDKRFHGKSRAYFKELPAKCPYDKEPLIMLHNVFIEEDKSEGNEGLCCVRCGRLFLHPHKKDPLAPSRSSHAPVNDGEVLAKQLEENREKMPPRPSSTILRAKIRAVRESASGSIILVSQKSQANPEKCIYWSESLLSLSMMTAIGANSEKEFLYGSMRYQVVSYQKYADADQYIRQACHFCSSAAPQTIYIFSQKNLPVHSDNYEAVTALIPCKNREFPVPVTVYFEKRTQRYFMNSVSYSEIMEQYGLPYLRLESDHKGRGSYGGLREHSELNLLGYNVKSAGGLTAARRQALLGEIMDSGLMDKTDIMNHLEWLIQSRDSDWKMFNAVAEWRSDLRFVNHYQISRQRSIFVQRLCSASDKHTSRSVH